MKQITIRSIADEVAKVIEREARKRKKSRNKVVLSFPAEATGVPTA